MKHGLALSKMKQLYDAVLAGIRQPISVLADDHEDAAWQALQYADDMKTFLIDIKPHGQETGLSEQLESDCISS